MRYTTIVYGVTEQCRETRMMSILSEVGRSLYKSINPYHARIAYRFY